MHGFIARQIERQEKMEKNEKNVYLKIATVVYLLGIGFL